MNDSRLHSIYKWAEKEGLPIVFTQVRPLLGAFVVFPRPTRYSWMMWPAISRILNRFDASRTLWQDEAFMVVEKNPNVYIDTAAYLYEIELILTHDLVSRIGEDKLIFGTDYPMPSPPFAKHNMKEFVEKVKGLSIPDRVKEKIFSKNIRRVIDSTPSDSNVTFSLRDMIRL